MNARMNCGCDFKIQCPEAATQEDGLCDVCRNHPHFHGQAVASGKTRVWRGTLMGNPSKDKDHE